MGPGLHPQYTRAQYDWGGCGWPMYRTSPTDHRKARNPYMVAEQEFRTTTPEPASQLSSETVSCTAPHGSEPSEDDGSSPPSMEQLEAAAPATPSLTTTKCTQEMLENTTLLTQFGKKDTEAESQSHAARIQATLENAEVTEIKCAVFRALTRLRVTEMKEFVTRLTELKRRSPTRTTRLSYVKPCLTSSGQVSLESW